MNSSNGSHDYARTRNALSLAAILLTVILTGGGQAVYVTSAITELRSNHAHMRQELTDMKTEVRRILSDGMQFRYTSVDATADKQTMLELIQSVNARVAVSERRLDLLEDRTR